MMRPNLKSNNQLLNIGRGHQGSIIISNMETSTFDSIFSRPDLLMWTFLGAFVLYALNRLQDHKPFSLFTVLNIETGPTAKPSTVLFDMVVSSTLGALVVFALTSPETGRQAIAAGLGMTGLLSAAMKGK